MIRKRENIWAKDQSGLYYRITEGTGDNLSEEDIDNGYVDYIYYDTYESMDDIYNQDNYDGGMILLRKLYQNHTQEEIICIVAAFEDVELTVID